jgi:membrane protein
LLSVVPLLAMAFGIAKGFGLDEILQSQLRSAFQNQEEILNRSLEFADSYLKTTKGGMIAGIGLIMLLYTVMKLIMSIEESFNDVWGVKESRPYIRKFTDYLSLMLISPIIVIISSSMNVFITAHIQKVAHGVKALEYFTPIIYFFLGFTPYILIWLLLTLLYLIMPNTKVKFTSALVAGVIAGTIYQLVQWIYIKFQVGVSSYNAIYGSFAALPLFLFWMQLSWLIILIGAKLSFAFQNSNKYEYSADSSIMSNSFKRLLALVISHMIIKNFVKGDPPLSFGEIAQRLTTPSHFLQNIINELLMCRIISEIKLEDTRDPKYQPAQDVNRLSINYIIQSLNHLGESAIRINETPVIESLKNHLAEFKDLMEHSDSNKLLKDID